MRNTICYIFICFLLTLVLRPSARADLVVNEVMVNEPGGQTSLEWFEIYNNSPNAKNFNLIYATIGINNIVFPGVTLDGYGYLIVARDTAGVKNFWSNVIPSGTKFFETSFPVFSNSVPGFIELYEVGNLQSELNWTTAGEDNVSWERATPQNTLILPSVDPAGSTPGFVNSVTPLPNDLGLTDVERASQDDSTVLVFYVTNTGLNDIDNGRITLFRYNENNPNDESDVIGIINIPITASGYTTVMTEFFDLPGEYIHLGAALNDDDRIRNNRMNFYAPGRDFPPFRLTEFLANPETSSGLSSEWIEIKNIRNYPINLYGWQFGDELSLNTITNVDLIVDPGEYLVLVQDSISFLSYYTNFEGQQYQPSSWASLNNGDDLVRFVDSFAIVGDDFQYTEVFDDNFTWSLGETSAGEAYWGRSRVAGGTPGADNLVRFELEGGDLTLNIEPQIFSPDGDGWDDYARITFDGPTESQYTLKIFNRNGEEVYSFLDESRDFRDEYRWPGTTNGGRLLPLGIYIVYLEASGEGAVKKTVVIAH